MIHANGPAKDILPWLENMRKKCIKEENFITPFPIQLPSPKGSGVKFFMMNENESSQKNLIDEEKLNEIRCVKSLKNIKDKLKVCYK